DFALELNAFKDFLPGVFDNYFRLEKLDETQARLAMEEPLKKVGYSFEGARDGQGGLLDEIFKDLSCREDEKEFREFSREQLEKMPLLVEPPHLQIVCQELWLHYRDDKTRQITWAAYRGAKRASGILEHYFLQKINEFNPREKRLASFAFDYLTGKRSTKNAMRLSELAEKASWVREKELQKVLDKLEKEAVLRRQTRKEEVWYELYHDLFSLPINSWNQRYKAQERRKRGVVWGVIGLVATGVIFAGGNWWINYRGRYLQLSSKTGVSDRIEMCRGREKGWNLFGLGGFGYESPFLRQKLEADKRFYHSVVEDKENTRANLVGSTH
ncbi:MAG: hypothetical protein D3903_21940, partial [Candidatus Electrothrix sp. GM3_4]|nr:hypothetical protein [Candidatus Electrothrix sp. GM3_4]